MLGPGVLATGKRLAAPAGSFPVRPGRSRNRTHGRLQLSRPAGLRAWRLILPRRGYFRMLTARATTSATVMMEMTDCRVMASFAQRDSGITSVGLNADALVNAR